MRSHRCVASPLIVAALVVGCTGDRGADAPRASGESARAAAPAVADSGQPATAAIEAATRDLVAFLSTGAPPFDSLALADSVELRVAPEGGGARRRVPREALRERAAWGIDGSGVRYSLVPPPGYTSATMRAGRHFACQEAALEARAPDLAPRPHVGVRLQPPVAESCLQSWNATFVFDSGAGRPRLQAVVYDQWEW